MWQSQGVQIRPAKAVNCHNISLSNHNRSVSGDVLLGLGFSSNGKCNTDVSIWVLKATRRLDKAPLKRSGRPVSCTCLTELHETRRAVHGLQWNNDLTLSVRRCPSNNHSRLRKCSQYPSQSVPQAARKSNGYLHGALYAPVHLNLFPGFRKSVAA